MIKSLMAQANKRFLQHMNIGNIYYFATTTISTSTELTTATYSIPFLYIIAVVICYMFFLFIFLILAKYATIRRNNDG